MSTHSHEYSRSVSSSTAWKLDFPLRRQLALALRDLGGGLADWRLWTFMARHEIRQRYRRSTLGPLWLTLGLAINVIAISTIWSHLFVLKASEFVPYLTIGMMVWNLINTNLPLSAYACQTISRNCLIASHNLIVYLGAALVFQLTPNENTAWVVPGTLLMIVATSWPPLLLGVLSTRFRDIPLIIQNAVTVAFFLTPVLWHADQLGDRAFFATMNPITHLIEIVRAPLLGKPLGAQSWNYALGTAAVGWSVTLVVFARYRARIPYWL
jgi:ABC-type polysaccharide/polyol phosphate export permease